LDLKKKITLLKNILNALSDCHALNIIHRDLKPQNIILSPLSYKPKLIDFGLSLLVDKNT
jgi:serine/threonine protein kinase